MSARCEIDLSPGTDMVPRKGPAMLEDREVKGLASWSGNVALLGRGLL